MKFFTQTRPLLQRQKLCRVISDHSVKGRERSYELSLLIPYHPTSCCKITPSRAIHIKFKPSRTRGVPFTPYSPLDPSRMFVNSEMFYYHFLERHRANLGRHHQIKSVYPIKNIDTDCLGCHVTVEHAILRNPY